MRVESIRQPSSHKPSLMDVMRVFLGDPKRGWQMLSARPTTPGEQNMDEAHQGGKGLNRRNFLRIAGATLAAAAATVEGANIANNLASGKDLFGNPLGPAASLGGVGPTGPEKGPEAIAVSPTPRPATEAPATSTTAPEPTQAATRRREPTATPDQAMELGVPVVDAKDIYSEELYAQLIRGRDVAEMIPYNYKSYMLPQPDWASAHAQLFNVNGVVPLETFAVDRGDGVRVACVLFALGEKGYDSTIGETTYKDVRFVPVALGAESKGQLQMLTEFIRTKGVDWKGTIVNVHQYWEDFTDLGDTKYLSDMPNNHPEYRFTMNVIGGYDKPNGWLSYDNSTDLSLPGRKGAAHRLMPGSYVDLASGAPKFSDVSETLEWARSKNELVFINGLVVDF